MRIPRSGSPSASHGQPDQVKRPPSDAGLAGRQAVNAWAPKATDQGSGFDFGLDRVKTKVKQGYSGDRIAPERRSETCLIHSRRFAARVSGLALAVRPAGLAEVSGASDEPGHPGRSMFPMLHLVTEGES